MAKHAFLSASGAPAWTRCEAKVWREKDLPDETSVYADEGTAAHFLLDMCLKSNVPAENYKGLVISVDVFGNAGCNAQWVEQAVVRSQFEANDEMCEAIQKTLDLVTELAK